MAYLHKRARSQANKILRWLFEPYANRKAMCDSDPVQRWLHIGNFSWDVNLIVGQHAISDTVHDALDRSTTVD
jgi:hypothetical protein